MNKLLTFMNHKSQHLENSSHFDEIKIKTTETETHTHTHVYVRN